MTNNYLSSDEFMPYAPDELGASVHVHHCRTGKGKNKMYVTRNQDGSVIAFCHHCAASGFYSVHGDAAKTYSNSVRTDVQVSNAPIAKGTGAVSTFSIPGDAEGRAILWPKAALDWTRQFLTDNEISDSPLTYSAKQGAIVFPIVNTDYPTTIVVYQLRYFPEKEPKYMTYKNNSLGPDTPHDPFYMAFSDTLVITEDWISAYKAALAGFEGLPLLGTNLRDSQLNHILRRKYKRFIIALDHDNHQVRRLERVLDTRLSGYAPTLLLKLTKDLKYYSLKDIKDLIT